MYLQYLPSIVGGVGNESVEFNNNHLEEDGMFPHLRDGIETPFFGPWRLDSPSLCAVALSDVMVPFVFLALRVDAFNCRLPT